jgi:hypothetical protein
MRDSELNQDEIHVLCEYQKLEKEIEQDKQAAEQ